MEGDTPIESAELQLLSLFNRLRRVALGRNPVHESGVTGPQLTVLDRIAAWPGCGVQEIADDLGLTAPTVSVTVRRLEEAGLLMRRPDPADGRAVQLFLEPRGEILQQQAVAFRLEKMRRLLAGLTPDERETLLAMLQRAISAAETTEGAQNA